MRQAGRRAVYYTGLMPRTTSPTAAPDSGLAAKDAGAGAGAAAFQPDARPIPPPLPAARLPGRRMDACRVCGMAIPQMPSPTCDSCYQAHHRTMRRHWYAALSAAANNGNPAAAGIVSGLECR